MDTKKILSSDILDIIFEDRNKDYGAYELRKTYHRRILRALLITGVFAFFLVISIAWAGAKKTPSRNRFNNHEVEISKLKDEVKKIEPIKPLQKPPEAQVQMKAFTPPLIKPNDEIEKPPPQVDDLDKFKISDVDKKGIEDIGVPEETKIDDGRDMVEAKKTEDDDHIWTSVQVQASFPGGDAKWKQYLERNCNGQVATDNGAPDGVYTIMVQFIVDRDGSISDVRALTNHGYGLEDEAKRVIKNGPKWNPANQNGVAVKAYRQQPITFKVSGEE